MTALLIGFVTFLSTLAGGLFGIKYRDKLHYIISFTAGVLIAVAFFDIIPELFEMTAEHNLNITHALIAMVGGFFAIHIVEKIAVIHHSHETEYADHKHPIVGYVGASALAIHSFLDGVGIGLGFHVSTEIGLLISIAVIAHDFSDGLNTVSIMLLNRNSIKKAFHLLLVVAIAPIAGVLATLFFTIPPYLLVIYLGIFGGFLLYLGASDLLPEAHSAHSSYKLIGLTIAGTLFIFIVTRFL